MKQQTNQSLSVITNRSKRKQFLGHGAVAQFGFAFLLLLCLRLLCGTTQNEGALL